jgi:hypothetical protein
VLLPLTGGDPTKGLGDPDIVALLRDARHQLYQYATPAWIEHSPTFVGDMKDIILELAAMQARSNPSSSTTSFTAPPTAMAQERAPSATPQERAPSATLQKRAPSAAGVHTDPVGTRPAALPAVPPIQVQRVPSTAATLTTPSTAAGAQARSPALPPLDIAAVRSNGCPHHALTLLSFRCQPPRTHSVRQVDRRARVPNGGQLVRLPVPPSWRMLRKMRAHTSVGSD